MRLGLIHINMGPMSRPDALVQAARQAEQAGFDSVWAGEHLVLPDPQVPPSPMAPQEPALDSLLALTWAAAHTATIRLATGIVILPQRNPVLLAKQVATLDVLSGGRVMLGVGAGYLEPEFRAVGANFAERGAVTDEYLDAMRALWYDEHPEFRGRFASFGGVDAHPRPAQRPIPLVVGGHRQEDAFWQHTLTQLAAHFGEPCEVDTQVVCVDRRRQWSKWGNVWHSAAIRSALYTLAAPARLVKRLLRRDRALA